jgi:hypothetical protein
MSSHDRELADIKVRVDRLLDLLSREAGIIARSEPSTRLERILTQIEQLSAKLETFNRQLETQSEADFRQLVERPDVERDDRNTRRDIEDAEGDDDPRVDP